MTTKRLSESLLAVGLTCWNLLGVQNFYDGKEATQQFELPEQLIVQNA